MQIERPDREGQPSYWKHQLSRGCIENSGAINGLTQDRGNDFKTRSLIVITGRDHNTYNAMAVKGKRDLLILLTLRIYQKIATLWKTQNYLIILAVALSL